MSAEDFESRLAALEERVAALEEPKPPALQQAAAVPQAPTVRQAPVWPQPPAVRAGDVPYWQMPKGAPPDFRQPLVPQTAVRASSSSVISDLEERLAGRALAVTGGIALVLGTIFFLSLAFSRGWIGPELRVLIGLVAGGCAVAGGAAFLERRNDLIGNVLTPVGLAIISISLVGATRLYHLVPVEVGLFGAFVSAIAVAFIAVRNDSQLVALFGLVSVLVAPPILGASPDPTTLAFIGITLVGTTCIALWRSWSWLPPVAFVLTVPQAASWILDRPPTTMALIGIAAYWTLNLVAAGGEEFRRHRHDVSPSSSTLLLGNAAFLVWAGFVTLDAELATYRGLFLLAVSVAHLFVGTWFVARDGDDDLFGLLAIGTGLAALTMAMPIQLGAPAVPVAWTAEAVALAWVAVRRGHPYSLGASGVLYVLAGIAIIGLYPLFVSSPSGTAFLDARGGALAFYLAGVGAGIWLLRDRSLRSGLASLGLFVAVYAGAAAVEGAAFVAISTVLMVAGALTLRVLPRLPVQPIAWRLEGLVSAGVRQTPWRSFLDPSLLIAVVSLGCVGALHLVVVDLPVTEIAAGSTPAIPFTDLGSITAGVLICGVLASGWILGGAVERGMSVLAAGAIAAYVIPFQVPPWAVAVLWVALGIGALLSAGRNGSLALTFEAAGATLIGMAALVTVAAVAPPSRLVVGPVAVAPADIIASIEAMAAVAIGSVMIGQSRLVGDWRRWFDLLAAGVVVYLLSIVAMDVISLRIGGSVGLEELQTQGQVVLSVLWAILGLGALGYGIWSGSRDIRLGGLGLLAVATTKVFLFDLAALDVAYRVISLIALGILLLVSAWVWQRAQRPGRSSA